MHSYNLGLPTTKASHVQFVLLWVSYMSSTNVKPLKDGHCKELYEFHLEGCPYVMCDAYEI